ncbi:MAG TPA: DUF4968 domain-containing protein [Anaerolineae bacterium]|nr:DUF4968 domain-containing protein [Anaerolineae bacterium]
MKIRSLADALYLLRFALRALPPSVMWKRFSAQVQTPFIVARYINPDGTISPRPRPFLAVLASVLGLSRRPPSPVEPVGDAVSWHHQEARLDITCHRGVVRLEFLAPDLVRVRLSRDGSFGEPRSYAVEKTDWAPVPVSFSQADDYLEIRSERLVCRVEKALCRLAFATPDGRLIARQVRGMGWRGREVWCSYQLPARACVYGLGEKAFGLARQGRRYVLWNTDPEMYDYGDDPLYKSIPFFIVLHQGAAYGIFLDNPFRSSFDFGASSPQEYTFAATGGELRYYFIWGPNMAHILERYTELTGRMPLPPLWALGYQQCRWSYSSEREVRELAQEFRRRHIPCDVIYLDTDYMLGWRCFTWHRGRFPHPHQMLADLRREGFKVVSILDPGIKVDPDYQVCKQGLQEDVFCKLPDGTLYKGPVWPGDCYFPDFTDARVREWWGNLHRKLVEDGVAGFWNDMNEPAVFGARTFPAPVQHRNDGHPTDHRECHNVYGLLMTRATYEGVSRLQPGDRVFVLTRSTFAGGQRYGATWTGDNASTWEHLRLSIAMCLSMGLSGYSFVGPDIGGFARSADGELLARWTQLGAFLPFFRNHSAIGTARQEPWAFGQPYEEVCRRFIGLRYHLLPYLYTAFWRCAQSGLPITRPLVMEWPQDPEVWEEDSEFLCGNDLLVAPVLEAGAGGREIYLPQGTWFDFWQNTALDGPQHLRVIAPLDSMPLYVRAGAVIPCWPEGVQYVEQGLGDTLVLRLYPGQGESWLYEDDGHSLDYIHGHYRLTHFIQEADEKALRLSVASEGPFSSPYRRWEFRIHGLVSSPRRLKVDGEELQDWTWLKEERTLRFIAPPLSELEVFL